MIDLKSRSGTTLSSRPKNGHDNPVYPSDVITRGRDRKFTNLKTYDGLNQLWVADITYIRLRES